MYNCDRCDYNTTVLESFIRHRERKELCGHTKIPYVDLSGPNPYECLHCGRGFCNVVHLDKKEQISANTSPETDKSGPQLMKK